MLTELAGKYKFMPSLTMILLIVIAFSGCAGSKETHAHASHPDLSEKPRKNSEAGVTITAEYHRNASEFRLHLHTFSVTLDCELDNISYIRDSSGNIIRPEAWESGTCGQHVEGTLKFPKFDDSNGFELVIQDIAGAKERVIKW
ncbi:MAG TPA: hypothetical protein HA257_06750 [Candidatus Methanoperedenaceae archaeon]|nr:hypothetical protein [Candidatus Methanoperedenaceae archaeon]